MVKKLGYMTDEQILGAVSSGDASVLGELYRRYYPFLRTFICGMLKDPAKSEDIAQNIFMRLVTSRRQFSSAASFRNWLYVCARNEVIDTLRSKWESAVDRDEELLAARPAPAEAFHGDESDADITAERMAQLEKILASMPEKRAEIFRMNKLQQMTPSQIASALGISPRTVQKHIELAYKQIRKTTS